MTNEPQRVADYMARRLVEVHGFRHAFLVTGGGAMHLNDALGRTPGLGLVFQHHEQACAMAAEGYARACGRPALVNVTTGPGGTNALTGVFGQWTDSVPALYVSGQIRFETSIHAHPGVSLRQVGDQEVDIVRLVAPLTKFAATVREPRQARRLLDKAVRLAVTGRPGPVWLDVPLDVQAAPVREADMEAYDPSEDPEPVPDPPGAVEAAFALLKGARRPVLLAGHGLRLARARADLLLLAERLRMPLLGTFNGADLVPSSHPDYVGRVGTLGSRAGNFALQNCDLLLAVGTRNNIRQVGYSWPSFARAARKVVVDIDPAELHKRTVVPDLAVRMDAGDFVRGLLSRAKEGELPDWSDWRGWCLERRRRYPAEGPRPARKYPEGVDPYAFVAELCEALPEGAVVVCGDGTASVIPFQAAAIKEGQRYIWNSGCASMGYDLPAAVGAAVATGGPVVCLAGDGSAMMNLQELETIAHRRLPVKVFLLNNRGYSSIRQTQNAYFDGRLVGVDPASGVGFPDFTAVARAFGLETLRIAAQGETAAAVARALAHDGPVFCEVALPRDYAFEPKLSSARLPDGRMVSKPLEDLSPLLERPEFLENMLIPPLPE